MDLKFGENNLIPAISQDYLTGEVLIFAYMSRESYDMTVETGYVHYFSRSRNAIWKKGETSGNVQKVRSILYDCDCDALLITVMQEGPACHTGKKNCFYRAINGEPLQGNFIDKLCAVIKNRRENPADGSYTNYLFDKGIDKILKKIGEESAEVIIAAKNADKSELVYEISDLIYHLCVLMDEKGVSWEEINKELHSRSVT